MSGFISCDWGTTNLRLRWVDASTGMTTAGVAAPEGVKHAYGAWQARGGDRTEAYHQVLAPHVHALREEIGDEMEGAPIIISGMASSSIGIEELPYSRLPFSLEGAGLDSRLLARPLLGSHQLILISGVRSESDVMRGEETQLVGLRHTLDDPRDRVVFILPGTHSKHVVVEGARVTSFRTFMTGELFEAVSAHTILRDSIEPTALSDERMTPFLQGVRAAADSPLLHSLFRTRTNQLFQRLDRPDNFWYLSGAFIGDELAALVEYPDHRLILAGSGQLAGLYEAALETLGFGGRLSVVPSDVVERSVAAGQMEVFRRL